MEYGNLSLSAFRAAVHQAWNAVVITSVSEETGYAVQYANPAFLEMSGYTLEELIGKSLKILQGPDTDQAVLKRLRDCLQKGERFEGQTFNYRKSGERYLVRWSISPVYDDAGVLVNYISVQADLTELYASRGRNFVLEAAMQSIPDPIAIASMDLEVEFCNSAAQKLLGCEAGKNIASIMNLSGTDEAFHSMIEGLQASRPTSEFERVVLAQQKPDGRTIYVDSSIAVISNHVTGARKLVFIGKDISDSILRENTLQIKAQTDPLTGVFNRGYGEDLLNTRIKTFADGGSAPAIFMLDIDNFKLVNDTHGHDVGDEVLRLVVQSVLQVLRPSDQVVRWGGEEFLLIFQDISRDHAETLAERVRTAVAREVHPEVGTITVSIGVAFARPGETSDDVLLRADQALYRAKALGRNTIEFA